MVQLPIWSQNSLISSTELPIRELGQVLKGNAWGLGELNLPKTPLFGTDGIRGKVGDLLTAPLAMQVGFHAGRVLQTIAGKTGPVLVGQDSRNSSSMLSMALASGLTAAGVEVWDLGLCPTPCVAYLTSATEGIGGVMISASHNPPEDNGIKFFGGDGMKLPAAFQAQIEAGIRGQSPVLDGVVTSHRGQQFDRTQQVQTYINWLQQSVQSSLDLTGMRIVLDLAWGAAVDVAPAVFRALGAEVISLHDQPNGDRINVNCGSTHLELLKQAVADYHADMGFAFDGDADRVMAVDSHGRVVDGDYILYFWGRTLQQSQQLPNNLIVATVMANLGFERAWNRAGGKLIRTAVGDQHVQAAMLKEGGMLGGEQSGHILCHHYSVSGDGVLTALHLAALVQKMETSLADLVTNSFQTYPQILKNVRVEDRDRRLNWQNCDPLTQAITQAETAMGDQGRILVRASGTEPLIRVMVEAESSDLTTYWSQYLAKVVETHLV